MNIVNLLRLFVHSRL